MSQAPLRLGDFKVSELSTGRPTRINLRPDDQDRKGIADDLGLLGLRKLSFAAEISAVGKRGWRLTGTLGATVVQSCVVTLEPVTTRIDETVERRYLPNLEDPDPGSETEMPDDDSVDQLGEVISAYDVMIESLSLALPAYPRADGTELGNAVFTEPGQAPMTDEDARPFASLKALRDKLDGDSEPEG